MTGDRNDWGTTTGQQSARLAAALPLPCLIPVTCNLSPAVTVLPAMMERRRGVILNIASTSGKRWYRGQGAYCAAKHGVLGLTKVLAEEMREHNIRVSAICPGGVNTRLVQEQRDDIAPEEWMDPEDIAGLAVYLASLPPKAAIDEVVIRRFASSPLHS